MKNLIFLTLLAAMSTVAVAQNVIGNGDFEFPVVPTTGDPYIDYPEGSLALPNWTVYGGDVSVMRAGYFNMPSQMCDVSGNSDRSGVGIRQTVPTTAGLIYRLQFDLATGMGYSGALNVKINGSPFVNSLSSNNVLTHRIFDFAAPTSSTVMAFENASGLVTEIDNIDLAPLMIAGLLALPDYVGDKTEPLFSFELRNPSGVLLESWSDHLDTDGRFAHPCPVVITGNFQLRIKGSHWLRKNLVVTGPTVTTLSAAPVNGDCNGDNIIDLSDYIILAIAFNGYPSQSNWNPAADLSGNHVVDLSDYTTLITNFNAIGD